MGIAEDLESIKELLEKNNEQEEKKKIKFRIPFGKKVSNAQRKKNYVTVVIMNENNGLRIEKLKIEDETIIVDKVPRLAAAGYVWYHKKNPWIFLPSWSVQPINAKQEKLNSEENGSSARGMAILLAKMESQVQKAKGQMGGALKWILGIGLAIIIAWAFLSGGG